MMPSGAVDVKATNSGLLPCGCPGEGFCGFWGGHFLYDGGNPRSR